jgi:hypothetical protein
MTARFATIAKMVKYFSQQTGAGGRYDLPALRRQLKGLWAYFEGKGYFAEWEGYACVDGRDTRQFGLRGGGWVNGHAGDDLRSYVFAETARDDLFPVDPTGEQFDGAPWTEGQIFDAFQFYATVISKPTATYYHSWNECGHHPTTFDHAAGVAEYRARVNEILARYGDGNGWELGTEPDLAIVSLAPSGMEPLIEAPVSESIDDESRRRVSVAIQKFRGRGATVDDKRDAVRDLGDVLEKYRSEAKAELSKGTETAIFNLLNNYGIRHNNVDQKVDYSPILMDGMFYHMLNAINTLAQLLRAKQPSGAALASLKSLWPK